MQPVFNTPVVSSLPWSAPISSRHHQITSIGGAITSRLRMRSVVCSVPSALRNAFVLFHSWLNACEHLAGKSVDSTANPFNRLRPVKKDDLACSTSRSRETTLLSSLSSDEHAITSTLVINIGHEGYVSGLSNKILPCSITEHAVLASCVKQPSCGPLRSLYRWKTWICSRAIVGYSVLASEILVNDTRAKRERERKYSYQAEEIPESLSADYQMSE